MRSSAVPDRVTARQVTVNGKTVKAVQGQRMRDAVRASGAKIEYGCEEVGSGRFPRADECIRDHQHGFG